MSAPQFSNSFDHGTGNSRPIYRLKKLIDFRNPRIFLDHTKGLVSGSIQVGAETVLGMIKKGVPEPNVRTSFYVAINEEGFVSTKPVTAVLAHLASAATYVIKLFDDPSGGSDA